MGKTTFSSHIFLSFFFERAGNVSILARKTVTTVFQSCLAFFLCPQLIPPTTIHRRTAQWARVSTWGFTLTAQQVNVLIKQFSTTTSFASLELFCSIKAVCSLPTHLGSAQLHSCAWTPKKQFRRCVYGLEIVIGQIQVGLDCWNRTIPSRKTNRCKYIHTVGNGESVNFKNFEAICPRSKW